VQHIRAHAQKFLVKLVKLIEGEFLVEELSVEDAEYYFGILNEKRHKSHRLVQEKQERQR